MRIIHSFNRSILAYYFLLVTAIQSYAVLDRPISEEDSKVLEPFLKIRKNTTKAITGSVLYAGALGLEWGLIYPWSNRMNKKMLKTENPDSVDISE